MAQGGESRNTIMLLVDSHSKGKQVCKLTTRRLALGALAR